MTSVRSAQDFVRALKAATDPPQPGGSSKIETARQAWLNKTLYLPNKEEVIADWLLTRLLKDRMKAQSSNSVFDFRYWTLLLDILSVDKPNTNGRASRPWLIALVNRVPIAPIITSFLSTPYSPAEGFGKTLDALVAKCFAVLWPLAVPKCGAETLLECFGAVLARSPSSGVTSMTPVYVAVILSFRTAFSNSTNKKKLYAAFLKTHIPTWLRYTQPSAPGHDSQEVLDAYTAGVEVIFCLDILRQAGDKKCDAALKEVLATSISTEPTMVLRSLPRILKSFVQSIKRHRNALFSQGSNQAPGDTALQIQDAGMAFFNLCNSLLPDDHNDLVWQTRIALLEIVNRENMFNPRDDDQSLLLRNNGELAIQTLGSAWDELYKPRTNYALDLLCVLTQIDYDIMSSTLPIIIPKLATIPDQSPSAQTYLNILLDYHTKTRTVHSYVLHCLDAFSVHHLRAVPKQSRDIYVAAFSGPLLTFFHLDRLSKVIPVFVTPGQVVDIVRSILQRWKEAFDTFKVQDHDVAADLGAGARKKRKTSSMAPGAMSDPEWAAVTFALLSRATVAVLTSLPVHSIVAEVLEDIKHSIDEVYTAVIPRALKGVLKALGASDRKETWGWQIVACATLRVHYGLATAIHLSLCLRHEDKTATKLISILESDEILPELSLEIVRNVLQQATVEDDSFGTIEALISYLERYLRHGGADWNGKSYRLSSNVHHNEGAIALFHVILDRWLPLLNDHASVEQLQRLAKLIAGVDVLPTIIAADRTLSAPLVVSSLLRNAEFWELHQMRDMFLAQLQERTEGLESIDVQELLSKRKSSRRRSHANGIPYSSTVFEVLLHAPDDYLPRHIRAILLRRAITADIALAGVDDGNNVTAIREFLWRSFAYIGSADHPFTEEYLRFLMEPSSRLTSQQDNRDDELFTTTLELIHMHLLTIFKLANKGDVDIVVRVVQSFVGSPVFQDHSGMASDDVHRQSLLRLINVVITQSLSSCAAQLVSALKSLQAQLVSQCRPRMQQIKDGVDSVLGRNDSLEVWAAALKLGRWLQLEGGAPDFGRHLIASLFSGRPRPQDAADACITIFEILLQELYSSQTPNRPADIEHTVAAYLALYRLCGSTDNTALDSQTISMCKTLDIAEFSFVLDFVYEALATIEPFPESDIAILVRFSALLVQNAPEGTLKVTQSHMTRCLSMFANKHQYLTLPSLRHEMLTLINRHFNEHPASIRLVDMNSVWSILNHVVTGSAEHDPSTDHAVFHQAIAIVSALIRLRRDLVLHSLPQLGMVLRQLILSLRSLRPQLGGKQSKLVLGTLPRWIAANKPLSVEESKALARLLTTLTTKTIVRTFASPAESQKAESLIRPFSKHAAGVLVAYIDAIGDPLCILSTQVRRELQSGLFALCEMMGEHNRDSMMVSTLDAGGKAMMKTLWKEFDKQRYVGKG